MRLSHDALIPLADLFDKLSGPENVMAMRDQIVRELRTGQIHIDVGELPPDRLVYAYENCLSFALTLRAWLMDNAMPTGVGEVKNYAICHLTIDNTLAIAMTNMIQMRLVRDALAAGKILA